MALTNAKVRAAKSGDKSYKLTDGDNMHLLVHTNGSKYWRLRYRFLGKEKTFALGVYPDVSLVEARLRRSEARRLIADGTDPCANRKAQKKALKAASAKPVALVHRTPSVFSHMSENDLVAWLQQLAKRDCSQECRIALTLLLLTNAQPDELLIAQWDEIDFDNACWTPSGVLMKQGLKYVVPLSRQAIRLLMELKDSTGHSRQLFPAYAESYSSGGESDLLTLLQSAGLADKQTGEGFRYTLCKLLNRKGIKPPWHELLLVHVDADGIQKEGCDVQHLDGHRQLIQLYSDYIDECSPGSLGLEELLTRRTHTRRSPR
uniref:tyrosine-type recombinase/integrase n=1 Tax=Scandinavium hiltneri TaxID=2926519 RepID=UPI0035ADDD26